MMMYERCGFQSKSVAIFLAAATTIVLGGCSSINHRGGFSGGTNQSFLLVAADGMPVTGTRSYAFYFQKVDLSNSTFLGERVEVDFTSFGPIGGNEFEKPRQLISTVRFGGENVSPGDYALVSRDDNVSYGASSTTARKCFSQDAPVFRIAERQIAIIPAGNVMTSEPLDAESTETQAMQVIASYPKYIAPAGLAKFAGLLAFDTGEDLLGRPACNPKGSFRFVGPQSVRSVVLKPQ
jgi:hypothetical protein